jgi:dUTP pyrophosphatase
MNVQITRIHPDATLPKYETADAAGFDLVSVADVTIEPGRVGFVPTGLVIQVPKGMFLGIFARSSTPLKRGLMVANGVGVIDPDYCGASDEVKMLVTNFTSAPVTVKAGDRIAQGMFLAAPRVEWTESEPATTSRGGFGSSGGYLEPREGTRQ